MSVPALAVLPALVAAAFLSAGAAKTGRARDVLVNLQNFGTPRALRNSHVARILPAAELLLGAALLVTNGWMFIVSAVAAAVVMALFIFVVSRALAQGERFDCGCFGAAHSPISAALLLRNVLLFIAATGSVLVGVFGFDGVVPTVARFTLDDLVWVALAAFLAVLTATFAYSTRPPTAGSTPDRTKDPRRLEGTVLPDLYLMTSAEEPVRILDMVTDRAQLIVLVRPGCQSCATLLEDASSLRNHLADAAGLILVVTGERDDFAREHPELVDFALFGAWPLASYLRLSAFPSAALVGVGGTVRSEPVAGIAAVRDLAAHATSLLEHSSRGHGPGIGVNQR